MEETERSYQRAFQRCWLKKSISFVPSETIAQQLEELSRITQMTPRAIVEDIVAFELENMFSSANDSAGWGATVRSLQSYLHRHNYSREDATKIAADYNVFVLREAQRTESAKRASRYGLYH